MIFIDFETTGLLKPSLAELFTQPYAIEFYGIRVSPEWKVVSELETLLKPPKPIPEFIEKLTGVTNDMVETAPAFSQMHQKFIDFFIGARVLIAHNCAFDRDVLDIELQRLDRSKQFPWPPIQICTVEKSFCIKNKRLKLGVLHEMATGQPEIQGAHRAKKDVMALIRSYKWLVSEGYVNETFS